MTLISRAKLFCLPLLALVLTVLLVDLVAYWLVPSNLVRFAPGYRGRTHADNETPGYARGYPRGYFRSDDELGFDIQENVVSARHVFAETSAEVFSNELGCFDRPAAPRLAPGSGFDYFAGDSFTWGYGHWQRKFATVYESRTSRASLKCGVTHTGQSHQFGKFQRIVARIGRYPERVVVGYYHNDIANDHAHPHSTVIDGFLVDTVGLDADLELVERDRAKVEAAVRSWLDRGRAVEEAPRSRVRELVRRYSLSANLLSFARRKWLAGGAGESGTSFYRLNDLVGVGVDDDYLTNPLAEANRNTLRRWAEDARKNAYTLVILLIPPAAHFVNPDYYAGVKKFLDANRIRYLDLAEEFARSGRHKSDFYWPGDGHLSDEGNEFVGELLARELR